MSFASRLLPAAFCGIVALAPHPAVAQSGDRYATDCAMATWSGFLSPGPQSPIFVESIDTSGGTIKVFRFAELAGEYGKLFVFLLDDGTCYQKVFSVGSYEFTARMKPDGPRLYHADLYQRGVHATMGFFDGPPDYREMREMALESLK